MSKKESVDEILSSTYSKTDLTPDRLWTRVSTTIEQRSLGIGRGSFRFQRAVVMAFCVMVVFGGIYSGVQHYETQRLDGYLYQVLVEGVEGDVWEEDVYGTF